MKKRVTRRTTRRAVARGTARRANPRYKLILDGYDWASIPAFNKTEAVKRAKEIYPDKKGKWTAEKVDERMFIGQRERAEELENQLRLERKRARAAERASGPPSRARRNGTHIHADMIDHLDVAKVHNPSLSFDEARAIYAAENDEGEGFTIGQDSDDIAEAATLAGWSVIDRYSVSLLLAADSAGNHFLIGGDATGRMPWVVKVEQVERIENPRTIKTHSSAWGRYAPGLTDSDGYIRYDPALVRRYTGMSDNALRDIYEDRGTPISVKRAIQVVWANQNLADWQGR